MKNKPPKREMPLTDATRDIILTGFFNAMMFHKKRTMWISIGIISGFSIMLFLSFLVSPFIIAAELIGK